MASTNDLSKFKDGVNALFYSFNTNEIMQTLKDIAKVKEVTIVIVTHDDLVYGLTDRNIYLEDGMVA